MSEKELMTDEEFLRAISEVARELERRFGDHRGTEDPIPLNEITDNLARLVHPRGDKGTLQQQIACSMIYAAREAVYFG
jgi:hypothetical protein